jgi:hypothetical protein
LPEIPHGSAKGHLPLLPAEGLLDRYTPACRDLTDLEEWQPDILALHVMKTFDLQCPGMPDVVTITREAHL